MKYFALVAILLLAILAVVQGSPEPIGPKTLTGVLKGK